MIRIISGTHRGRRILAPKHLPVRPTTDFAKESLFNILGNHFDFEKIKVLDLFSGTGAISYELASRGCTKITAVDTNPHCWKFIRETTQQLGFADVIHVVKANAFSYVKNAAEQFDLIFADPPFELKTTGTLPALVFEHNLLKPGGRLVVEHPAKPGMPPSEWFLELRTYGNVNFTIYGTNEEAAL